MLAEGKWFNLVEIREGGNSIQLREDTRVDPSLEVGGISLTGNNKGFIGRKGYK